MKSSRWEMVVAATLTLILTVALILNGVTNVSDANARRATRKLWIQYFPITSTAMDTLLPSTWEDVTFFTKDSDARMRVAATDTASFSSRHQFVLKPSMGINFGPADKVRRFEVVSTAATDTLYAMGYKTVVQTF